MSHDDVEIQTRQIHSAVQTSIQSVLYWSNVLLDLTHNKMKKNLNRYKNRFNITKTLDAPKSKTSASAFGCAIIVFCINMLWIFVQIGWQVIVTFH